MSYQDKVQQHTHAIVAGKSGYGAENPTGESQWGYALGFALMVLLPLIGSLI